MFFALQKTKMLPLHFVYKMLESGKMHFGNAKQNVMQKYIFAKHQMHFCTAEHFPKENVQQRTSKM